LNQGEAFYEPKNKTILHFDNACEEQTLVFIAFYLKQAGEDFIKMLD